MNPLQVVKVLHTLIWAVFAGCIVATPVLALTHQLNFALILAAIVLVEVLILVLNRMRCPLTNVATRYTTDRRANFDIYLPEWLARHNKKIFGPLYVLGVLVTAGVWFGWVE